MKRSKLIYAGDGEVMNGYSRNGGNDSDIQMQKFRPTENYIEAQVEEGDTLQAIALKFRCSVADLKRINYIHKENEIFARRTLKIPVTAYSMLTMLSLPTTEQSVVPLDIHDTMKSVPSTSSLTQSIDNTSCNETILNSQFTPAIIPYKDIPDDIGENTSLLPTSPKPTLNIETVVVKELTSHPADLGLKWYHLLLCILFICVVVPVVYIIFIMDPHEHHKYVIIDNIESEHSTAH